MRTVVLQSLGELRSYAEPWDDLWRRSTVASPTARAELVAQWVEQFAPRSRFTALAVEDNGRWLAALPFVAGRAFRGALSVSRLTGNDWSLNGDLLLDPAANAPAVLAALLSAARKLPVDWIELPWVAVDAPHWQAWLAACERARMPSLVRRRFHAPWFAIGHDWDAFLHGLSSKRRKRINQTVRRMEQQGHVAFALRSDLMPQEVEPMLRAGFEVEDRSWKGDNGSSVLRTPGMFSYFVRQARQLAGWGALDVATLRLNDRLIAFLYAYRAKGVHFGYKLGYDPHFAALSPGQMLLLHLLQSLYADPTCQAMDGMGPVNETTSHWRPQTYAVARIVVAPRRLKGQAALWAYRQLRRDERDASLTLPSAAPDDAGAGAEVLREESTTT